MEPHPVLNRFVLGKFRNLGEGPSFTAERVCRGEGQSLISGFS